MIQIKNKIAALLLLIIFIQTNSRASEFKVKSELLNQQAVDSIFSDSARLSLKINIQFNIFRVYQYEDKLGIGFIVLTENIILDSEGDEYIDSIKAFNFRWKDEKFILKWSFIDFYLPNGNEVSEEFSISFWTKYFELGDYDKDGIVDPIIVYGTLGLNGESDGRIKILIFHKGLKRAIRHQNGTLDSERNTKVDKKYYELPKGIKNHCHKLMESMTKNRHAIFPYGWQKAMKNKQTKFDEK